VVAAVMMNNVVSPARFGSALMASTIRPIFVSIRSIAARYDALPQPSALGDGAD
jgi:hypothetical protein